MKALLANKLKTLLIYLSLIFSIVSIFLISSISNGIITMYSSMLKSDGDIIITQAKISDTFFSNVNINLIEQINKISDVKEATALIVGASPVEKLPIVAIYGASFNRFKNYKLETGNYPKQNEVIVGKSIYGQLTKKEEIQQEIKQAVERVRAKTPLVPSITNSVTINLVANAQLAAGGSAAMVYLPDEGCAMAKAGGAMYINMGTLQPVYEKTLPATAQTLHEQGKPWVLDPVGLGIGGLRTQLIAGFKEADIKG